MKIQIDKKKLFTSIIAFGVILSLIVVYYSINLEFNHANDSDISNDQESYEESDSITKDDIIPPETILIEGPSGTIDYNNVTFIWSGSDDVTQTKNLRYSYRLSNVDNDWSFWTTLDIKTYKNLTNGNYTFFIKTIDEAGNIDPQPIEVNFKVDVKINETVLKKYYVYWPIKTEKVDLKNSYFAEKKQSFQKNISINRQNLKQINFKISWEDDFTSKIFNFGKDELTFTIKIEDDIIFSKKSVGSGVLSYNIADINEKPEISEIKADNYSSAKDIISNYFGLNLFNEKFIIKVEVKIKELRLLTRLRDKGNDFSLDITYEYYDLQLSEINDNPPKTDITSGPSGIIYDSNIKFSWKGSDDFTDESKIKYSFKLEPYDKTWSDWTYETSINYYNLDYGQYIFYIKSIDSMGNIETKPVERLFNIKEPSADKTPPTIELLSGPIGVTRNTTHNFTWIGSDDKTPAESLKYRYKLEGKYNEWSDWGLTTEITYTDIFNGDYTFIVEVIDSSGNTAEAKRSFIVEQWNKSRFVSKIIEFIPGESASSDLKLVFGEPQGCGNLCGSTDVLTLGNEGILTVGFNVTIINDPGYDFIVFENPFFVNGMSEEVFAELAYVEVSSDNVSYARFPCISTTENPVGNKGININNVTNLAGVNPVLANVIKNDLDPFDPNEAGGDVFDLDDLINDPLVLSGLVDLNNINYIRLIDIPGNGSCLDSLGNPIYDTTEGTIIDGADIDAISVINFKIAN